MLAKFKLPPGPSRSAGWLSPYYGSAFLGNSRGFQGLRGFRTSVPSARPAAPSTEPSMAPYTARTLKDLLESPPPVDSLVSVSGWIRSIRRLKKVAFIDLVDGSSNDKLMIVVPGSAAGDRKFATGAAITATGLFKSSPTGQQAYELLVESPVSGTGSGVSETMAETVPGITSGLEVLGTVSENYPLQKKFHSRQFLRTVPEFRWRTASLGSVLRFRSFAMKKISDFFYNAGWIQVSPPLITSSDCEGAGELFTVTSASASASASASNPDSQHFFGKPAYLTVSSQLHLEVLAAAAHSVWTFTPAFRAEESDTNRHLSEFWMVEAESSFVNDVESLTAIAEDMVRSVVEGLQANERKIRDDLLSGLRGQLEGGESGLASSSLESKWNLLSRSEPWARMSYTEAVAELQKAVAENVAQFEVLPVWGENLRSEHEKWLAGELVKGPVFVTDYPTGLKPFYMKQNAEDGGATVACFDLLLPEIGELIGGSVREADAEKLKRAITERGMNTEALEWYTRLRENGSVPHGGFGMGFERLIAYITGQDNVKDVIPFPRTVDNCAC